MRVSIPSIFFASVVMLCSLQSAVTTAQTVILVRHGQKLDATSDPVLSVQGDARATLLSNMLASAGVRAIYTTEYRRTKLHAAPTAKRLGLTPIVIAAKETDALLTTIRRHARDDVMLVVGHSNTLTAILKGLGHAENVTVTEEDFDNLFIVAMQAGGAPTMVRLKY